MRELIETGGIKAGGGEQPLPLSNSETIAAIKRTIEALHGSGTISAEVRVLDGAIYSGVFAKSSDLAEAAAAVELKTCTANLFVTVNPVKPELTNGRIRRAGRGGTVDDKSITRLRWLVIDVDAERATGVAASNSEKAAAAEVMQSVREHFKALGWPAPIFADSGNGLHALYPIDLPNDAASRALTKAATLRAANMFSTPTAHVDKSVYNPARILRLWSTINRKGVHSSDRPWRRSGLLEVPAERGLLTVDQLTSFIGGDAASRTTDAPAAASAEAEWDGGAPTFNMPAFLAAAGIKAKYSEDYNGGTRWPLEACPFNPEHGSRGEVSVFVDASGGPGFNCLHDHCVDFSGWVRFTAELKKQLAEDTAALANIAALEAREGWSNTAEGLYQVTRGGAHRLRLGSKLDIVARVRDADSAGWGFALRWTAADRKTKDLVVSSSELFSDPRAGLSKLVDGGYGIENKRGVAEALVVYITSATPRVELRVDRPGWHGDSFVTGDEVIQSQSGGVRERVHFASTSSAVAAYAVAGTLADWQREIGRYCAGNSRLALAVSAGFAGPLLRLLETKRAGFICAVRRVWGRVQHSTWLALSAGAVVADTFGNGEPPRMA